MYSKKNYPVFIFHRSIVLKILLVCICPYIIITGVSAQRTAAEKKSLCKQEHENLQKLIDKLDDLPLGYIYAIYSANNYKDKVLRFDDERLDEETASLLKTIQKFKDDIRASNINSMKQHLNLELKLAQAELDFVREITVKKELGETVDPKNNAMQKEITLLEQEKANIEDTKKYLLNDISMNKERIRQLGCSVPDRDDNTTNSNVAPPLTQKKPLNMVCIAGTWKESTYGITYIVTQKGNHARCVKDFPFADPVHQEFDGTIEGSVWHMTMVDSRPSNPTAKTTHYDARISIFGNGPAEITWWNNDS